MKYKISLVVCALICACLTHHTYAQCVLETLFASDAADSSRFGNSVAIDGDVMVIGAHEDGTAYPKGAAYIFRRINETWIEEAKLLASDGAYHDEFGWSVDISGDIAIVGARNNASAYIFRFVPELDEWVEQTKLLASDGAYYDEFGISVAISGTVAVVGANKHAHAEGYTNSGAAYVFTSNDEGQTWEQVAELRADDGAYHDRFGQTVDIDGDDVVIGALYDDDNNGFNSGSAYIFKHYPKLPNKWVQIQKLLSSDGNGQDNFGCSVAISEGVCAIGATGVDSLGTNAGAAYIFRYNDESQDWYEEAKLSASDGGHGDQFGIVAIQGNLAIVGAPGYSSHTQRAGAVFVYENQEDVDQWIEIGMIEASDSEIYSSFGSAVAIDNELGIIGWPWHDGAAYDAGAAYTFEAISNEDSNNNGIPDACENGIGDLNYDDVVDIADLQILLGFWGPCPNPPIECQADLFSDGIVNTRDLLILLANWE